MANADDTFADAFGDDTVGNMMGLINAMSPLTPVNPEAAATPPPVSVVP